MVYLFLIYLYHIDIFHFLDNIIFFRLNIIYSGNFLYLHPAGKNSRDGHSFPLGILRISLCEVIYGFGAISGSPDGTRATLMLKMPKTDTARGRIGFSLLSLASCWPCRCFLHRKQRELPGARTIQSIKGNQIPPSPGCKCFLPKENYCITYLKN